MNINLFKLYVYKNNASKIKEIFNTHKMIRGIV